MFAELETVGKISSYCAQSAAQGPMSTAVSLMVFATRAEPYDSALEFRIDRRNGPSAVTLARQIADR